MGNGTRRRPHRWAPAYTMWPRSSIIMRSKRRKQGGRGRVNGRADGHSRLHQPLHHAHHLQGPSPHQKINILTPDIVVCLMPSLCRRVQSTQLQGGP